jgi:glycogen debranching enzyme
MAEREHRVQPVYEYSEAMPNLDLNETILDVMHFTPTMPARHLPALKSIMRLTAAPRSKEIGLHGPSNAANATEEKRDVAELNLYDVFFPRDAHVVAGFLREKHPELTKATIMESLRFTGVRENLRSTGLKDEQELWKVPHEIRDGENDPIAVRLSQEKDWGWPYYGAVDTTVKNVKAIASVALDESAGGEGFLQEGYIGLDDREHTVGEALQGHLNWIRKRMDLNPEGLVESLWTNPKHHANQTWADSPDAFFHADGSWAEHHPDKNWGVASIELQAETYDALRGAIELYTRQIGHVEGERKKFLETEIQDLTARSKNLRTVVVDKFWVEDPEHFGGFFARGTDRDEEGNLRSLDVRSSDMGHLLNSEILKGDDPDTAQKREAVIRNLFSSEMLSPSGIRTLSTDSARYWEERYHGGNSWPWSTYYIALGLQKHGYYGLAHELKKRIWDLYDQTKILPEYASGSADPDKRLVARKIVIHDPTIEAEPTHAIGQPAQEIQAWTAAAVLAMKYEEGERVNSRLRPHRATDKEVPTKATDSNKQQLENEILVALHS